MTIIIARPEIAHSLQQKWASEREVRIFRDCDAVAAMQTITTIRPGMIALDPLFAATPRGATLIATVKTDVRLELTDIRLLSVEEVAKVAALRDGSPCSPRPAAIIASLSRPLDWCGTRRAVRVPITPDAPAAINGEPTLLVNLSTSGAQILSAGRLRPAEGFRLTLVNDTRAVRMQAVVAWSTLQGSTAAPCYRAGALFLRSDERAIQAFCRRYGRDADPLFVSRISQAEFAHRV
jgi:hypothetical protein